MAKAKKAKGKAKGKPAKAAKPAKAVAKSTAKPKKGAMAKARKVVAKAAKAAKKAVKAVAKTVKKAAKAVAPQPPPPKPTIGSVVHVEFNTPDVEGTKNFLGELLGLQFHPMGPNEYYFHGQGGWGPGGCINHGDASCTVSPSIYFQVDDIPGTLARANGLGATTVKEKTEIPGNHGFFAHFRTADGNLFALWSMK